MSNEQDQDPSSTTLDDTATGDSLETTKSDEKRTRKKNKRDKKEKKEKKEKKAKKRKRTENENTDTAPVEGGKPDDGGDQHNGSGADVKPECLKHDDKESEAADESSTTANSEITTLEAAYQEALQAFKADKTNKDLRRARSAAKKAWDAAVIANAGPGVEPFTCRNCSQLFLFAEQDKFTEKGYVEPSKCKRCTYSIDIVRSQDRSKRDTKQNMCYDYQKTGLCSRGDRCRFSHAENHVGKKRMLELANENAGVSE